MKNDPFSPPYICFIAGTQVVVDIEEAAASEESRDLPVDAGVAILTRTRVRYRTVAIEKLVRQGGGEMGAGGGQSLLTRDQHDPDGPLHRQRIIRTYERIAHHLQVLTLRDADGIEQRLRVTEEHPFHLAYGGWTPAKSLRAGDAILGSAGSAGTLTVVANAFESHPQGITVYNLEVEGAHTYFVRAEDSQGGPVWVHNADYANLNSNKARASYAIYQIEINGILHKIGKTHTGRITLQTGLPTRLHQQLRQLRDIHGVENVSYSLARLGRTTTANAKVIETRRLQEYFDRTGKVPKGNEKSFIPTIR